MSLFDSLAATANAAALTVYGEPVSYEQAPAAPFEVKVVFGQPRGLEGLDPTHRHCWVRLSDFAIAPAAGNVVIDGATVFDVVAVTPDDCGGAWLSLSARG